MTGLTAAALGTEKRGVLGVGYAADVLAFDVFAASIPRD
jgi:N-acyl-D-aspartate/D-glutamate deacylase